MEKKTRAFYMILSKGVIVSDENATAIDIARLMQEHNVGAVIIMQGEKLVGIVSERDIARRVIAKDLPAKTTKAKDFMTTEVVTAEFKEGLDKIYDILSHSQFRHLPIMDNDKLVGIASQRDVLFGLIGDKNEKTNES
ncbi:MAG: CBS domain-containing protein [Deltaproteobacteria bacterium]